MGTEQLDEQRLWRTGAFNGASTVAMDKIVSHKDLIVWQKAVALAC